MPAPALPWQQIKALFAEALEAAPAAREAIFAASPSSPEVVAEVRALLDAHDRAGTLAGGPLAKAVQELCGDAAGPVDGDTLERYRLIREIGRGGMGTVFLACRADAAFDKQVAIKIVRRGLDTEDVVRRFRQERQTLARLDHPNIARLLDGGTTKDGRPYFVMEHVDGAAIDTYCRTARLGIRARLDLFARVCDAVRYAHQNLVVHRDIKPENILVAGDGVPKLVDFGIAKVLAGPDGRDEAPGLTRVAQRPMTPAYASPELLRGEPVTTAADVYSLGVVLYELLAERHPFDLEGLSDDELRQTVCERPVPLPSTVAPGAWRRQLTGDLDTIVTMALRKEPERRYASVEQLAEDVRRYLEGLPVLGRRESGWYRAGKFVRRHAAAVTAAVLAIGSLCVGLAGVAWQARVAAHERDRARLEAEKAARVNTFLQEMLSSADPYSLGRDVTVSEVLARAAARIDRDLDGQPGVKAGVQRAIGATYSSLGDYARAEAHLGPALEAQRRLWGDTHLEVVLTRLELANARSGQGDGEGAEAHFRLALAAAEALGEDAAAPRASALVGLGQILRAKGREDEAEAAYREALALRRRLLGDASPAIAEVLNNLAVVSQSRGELDEAERLYREALAIVEAAQGAEHPGTAAALSNLAGVLHSKGNLTGAEPLYREALRLRQRVLGDAHPDVAFTLFNYADLLHALGRFDEAMDLSRRVLTQQGRSIPDRHPMISAAMLVLGKSLMDVGRLDEAERWLREALALRRELLSPEHWLTANTASVLGECLLRSRRYAEAEGLLIGAYERLLADRGPAHERTVEARRRLVALYQAWGRPARAAAYGP